MKASPNKRYHQAINPLARWATSTPGAKAQIVAMLDQIAPNDNGRGWNRQQVESYLNPDPARRHEPKLGAGLALIDAVNRVMDQHADYPRTTQEPNHKGI